MLVAELEIITDVRDLHTKKVRSPILVTESGITTDVRLLQYEKA